MMTRYLALGFLLILASTSLVGCGSSDDDNGNNPASGGAGSGNHEEHEGKKLAPGTYRGVFTGGSEMGAIEVTVPEASGPSSLHLLADHDTVSLTGSLIPAGGQPIEIAGSFNPATGAISLSGGGYSLNGTVTDSGFSGSFSGPNGSGNFQATSDADGKTKVYCGAITGAGNGPLTLLVTGATATGYVEPDGKTPAHLQCTIAGENIDCDVIEHPTVEFSGASNESGWGGTYENTKNGDKGDWSASACGG